MIDSIIKKLAKIILDWSIRIKKNHIITISLGVQIKPLILELTKLICKDGKFVVNV